MEDRIHIVSYPEPDRSISEKSIEDKNIDISKWLQNECEKYKLTFIDVGVNREEKLRKLANEICL